MKPSLAVIFLSVGLLPFVAAADVHDTPSERALSLPSGVPSLYRASGKHCSTSSLRAGRALVVLFSHRHS